MQRETSISSHEYNLPFSGDYDFAPSIYSPIFPPNHSSILDYLNDGASNFSSTESEDALAPPCMPQFQQQLLNQDLMNRHRTVLSRLLDAAEQSNTLRQENVNLKMANLDLNNRLNLLLDTAPFRRADAEPGLDNLVERLRKMRVEEKGASEIETVAKSPTSVMDSGQSGLGGKRVQLPKSISVRSNDYLKAARSGGSGSGSAAAKVARAPNEINGTQKVYVKGGRKEEAVELEVYNQGMLKTELCNKWQQTGACPYGGNCQFAHGVAELRPVLRHPRYKTEVCRMVLNGVPCPYGHRCHFRHSLTQQEQLIKAMAMNSNSRQPIKYR